MIKGAFLSASRGCVTAMGRIHRKLDKIIARLLLPYLVEVNPQKHELRSLGEGVGAWTVPVDILNSNSNCYCVGVGMNISFDMALVDTIKCNVYSFDPTPSSIQFMNAQNYDRDLLKFLEIGVWDEDTELRFYSPSDPKGCHSVHDLHGTGKYFTAKCNKLSTIMTNLGHDSVDLLKLDIEGAWQRVVDNVIEENINVKVLCVEFDSPTSLLRVLRIIKKLKTAGYILVNIQKDNYVFVRQTVLD